VGGDREAQDAVPQEGEPLVGLGALLDPRRVGEGLPLEIVGKLIQEVLEGLGVGAQDAVSGARVAM
jgi:hypothetical protein